MADFSPSIYPSGMTPYQPPNALQMVGQAAGIKNALVQNQIAQQTLQQSIDRFKVGAADSVEVAQSEDLVASDEQDYIGSLFALRLAEMGLAKAVGAAEQDIPKIVKGVRP